MTCPLSPYFESDAAKMLHFPQCNKIASYFRSSLPPIGPDFLLKVGYFLKIWKASLGTADIIQLFSQSSPVVSDIFSPLNFFGGGPSQGSKNGECHILYRLHMISSS